MDPGDTAEAPKRHMNLYPAVRARLRLHDVGGPRTAVVVAHDEGRIDTLVRRGVLREGLNLARP